MAQPRYQYGTSPRKVQPTELPGTQRKRNIPKERIHVVKEVPRQEVKISKEERKKQIKLTMTVLSIFIVLLTISYRNSQISVKFNDMQNQKKQLASLQKENEQLKVGIENSLNLNNLEKEAKNRLAMQKITNKQTVYINLPKKDYVEPISEKIVMEESDNWFENIINKILNR